MAFMWKIAKSTVWMGITEEIMTCIITQRLWRHIRGHRPPDGETPSQVLKQQTMIKLKRIKIEQLAMKKMV